MEWGERFVHAATLDEIFNGRAEVIPAHAGIHAVADLVVDGGAVPALVPLAPLWGDEAPAVRRSFG